MTSEIRHLSAPLARLADTLGPLAGKHIALIAPAGGVKDDRIDTALAVLDAAGIHPHLGAHARDRHRYLAGTAEARLVDLHTAFDIPDVAAVWCLRGGYGSAQFVDQIDWARIPADIPLIGFSDITVLLEAFRRHGCFALHGPVATQLALPGDTAEDQNQRTAAIASLVEQLQGQPANWPLAHISGAATPVSGQLVGGNLTTLASMAGTPAGLSLDTDSILLLEDVGEAEFRLERSFHQLLSTLNRDRLKAVCLGRFENCRLADDMRSLTAIVAEWSENIPLYTGLPMSHGYANHAWRCGATAQLADNRLAID